MNILSTTSTRMAGLIAGVCTMAALTACAEASSQSADPSSKGLTADIPKAHAAILQTVSTAQSGDSAQRLVAADRLRRLDAQPMEGAGDLVAEWTAQAIADGVTPDSEPPFRGRIKGPAYRQESLPPGGSHVVDAVYYAAQPAVMTLSADRAVSWNVVDASGEADAVCRSDSVSDAQACRFTPLWTSKYTVRISNPSDHDVTYLFVTN